MDVGWESLQEKWEKHLASLGCKAFKVKIDTGLEFDTQLPKSNRLNVYILDPFWADAYNRVAVLLEDDTEVAFCIRVPRKFADRALILGYVP